MKTVKYFSATWCQPCKQFKPVMQEIANEGYNVQFIDVDSQAAVAQQYGIRSVPSLVFEEDGNLTTMVVGVHSKDFVIARLT
mgnify:CR=1 FL=1|jgi:thioredoxin 1